MEEGSAMRVRWRLAGLVILQGLDLVLTGLLLSGQVRADIYEANPLAQRVLNVGGWGALAGVKAVCTLVALSAALLVLRWRPAAGQRLLALLCLLMLGVVGYSGALAVGPASADQRLLDRQRQVERDIDRAQRSLGEFVQQREAMCLDLLAGKLSLLEAINRHQDLIDQYEGDLIAAYRRTLPRRDEPAAQASYLVGLVSRMVEYDNARRLPGHRLADLQAEMNRLLLASAVRPGV
jgi:hypothetical protein